jgi:hypothetical protein
VCPVELSVGVGAKLATAYVSLPTGSEVNDRQKESAFALMLRARFWFLREHSPILDVGLASSRYSGGESFGHASFAVGYGYRSAEPVRLGIVIGAMAPPAGMGSTAGFGEVSVGVMW